MKRLCISLALALAWSGSAAAAPIAIVHARAWTMQAATPVEDATIVIDDGHIVSVQAHGAAPADATIIDALGKPVTPGLFNGATQLGLTEVSSASDTRDVAATAAGLGASFDVGTALTGNSELVALARADGLTRAFSFPSPSAVAPFDGQAAVIRLRPGVDILDLPRAAVVVTIGGGSWEKAAGSRAAQWQLLRAALDGAKGAAAPAGREAAALRPVLAGGAPLAIITHRESDIREAIRLATDYNIHVVIIGGAEAWRAAAALAAAHIPVILDPQANLPTTFDQLGARQDNAAILTRAGVTISFGLVGGAIHQNYNAGMALREGAGMAVANGLPYVEALKAVTVNPLTIWAHGGGTLTPGADADLVVWDGDPFEPSSGALTVLIEGRIVPTDTRQGALQARYRPRQP